MDPAPSLTTLRTASEVTHASRANALREPIEAKGKVSMKTNTLRAVGDFHDVRKNIARLCGRAKLAAIHVRSRSTGQLKRGVRKKHAHLTVVIHVGPGGRQTMPLDIHSFNARQLSAVKDFNDQHNDTRSVQRTTAVRNTSVEQGSRAAPSSTLNDLQVSVGVQ